MLSLLFLIVKAQQYFETSNCMFLDEKTVLENWLNPGLNLTFFPGTRPIRMVLLKFDALVYTEKSHQFREVRDSLWCYLIILLIKVLCIICIFKF